MEDEDPPPLPALSYDTSEAYRRIANLQRYRVDRWQERKPRATLPILVGILAVVAVVATVIAIERSATRTIALTAANVRMTGCSGFTETAVLTNPSGRRANLEAEIEVDDPGRYPRVQGTAYFRADGVAPHGSSSVDAMIQGDPVADPQGQHMFDRMTCHAIAVRAGGGAPVAR